ncbi:MAG TPA: MarR family transcriptional regulator [Spirochaetales bacterium]|nr:MarR family transcriptional regulator [Spirochaetales bacterium]
MSRPQLALDAQVCFLVYRLEHRILELYRPLLEPLGLTYPQYLAMLALWEHGAMTVGRLGELLRLDSGTVSPLLKRMEKAGLVTRTRSPEDERSVRVELTRLGAELEEKAAGVPAALVSCLGGGGEEEVRALVPALRAVLARLEGQGCR